MKRLTIGDKPLPDGWKRSALWAALTFLLSAAHTGGLYGPWGLAAVAAGGKRGLWPLLGAAAGALLFFDFQTGLRFAASAVLICCANVAFGGTKLSDRPGYAPALAALSLLLVQTVYLLGRPAAQWALCTAAAAVAAAVTAALERPDVHQRLLAVLTAVAAALSAIRLEGFSPGGVAAAWLALLCGCGTSPARAAALGAGIGLCADLAQSPPRLMMAAVCGCGALGASVLRGRPRLIRAGAFCLCAVGAALTLDADRPWMTLYESAAGAAAYLLLRREWLPFGGGAAEERKPEAAPAMASAVKKGAAFRDLYDAMFRSGPPERGENPSVIFDQAAAQVCRDCLLVKRCWQAEYGQTYNAFNDACGPMLKRGRAEAEDFPLYFTSRCLHFPALLDAVNREVYAFRLRRQYRARLADMRELAEAQYQHLGEALEGDAPEPEGALPLRCRVGTLLRPREGETACGDQLAVFTAGPMLYMLLSDGMGSGPEAHAESAMTVRLLRQFLKAGIQPRPALRTINTALTLRCQERGAFTTIDLLALDRHTGAATLYKYGAAPSYLKKDGTVTRLDGGSLPAGLQDARQPPETTGVRLAPGSVLVMVSDGVTGGGDGDQWLLALLADWTGGDSQELAQLILAESRRHGGLRDDCAALALRLEKSDENHEKRV